MGKMGDDKKTLFSRAVRAKTWNTQGSATVVSKISSSEAQQDLIY